MIPIRGAENLANKSRGTVFEKYVLWLLKKVYGGSEEILYSVRLRDLLKQHNVDARKIYFIYVGSMVRLVRGCPIKYLYAVISNTSKFNGNDVFGESLRERRYGEIRIIRADKILRVADFIAYTRNKEKVYLIDAKYYTKSKLTMTAVNQLYGYYKFLTNILHYNVRRTYLIVNDGMKTTKKVDEALEKLNIGIIRVSQLEEKARLHNAYITIDVAGKRYRAFLVIGEDRIKIHEGIRRV